MCGAEDDLGVLMRMILEGSCRSSRAVSDAERMDFVGGTEVRFVLGIPKVTELLIARVSFKSSEETVEAEAS